MRVTDFLHLLEEHDLMAYKGTIWRIYRLMIHCYGMSDQVFERAIREAVHYQEKDDFFHALLRNLNNIRFNYLQEKVGNNGFQSVDTIC